MDNISGESLRMEPAEGNIKERGRGSRASVKKRRGLNLFFITIQW